MLRTVSLFTGAGGLDLGIHSAGFDITAAVEPDADALATLSLPENQEWWSSCRIFGETIEKVSTRSLLRAAGIQKRKLSLVIGGPPCQPFSKSGYWHSGDAKRLNDPRSETLGQFLRVVEDALPEVFLLENVPGLAFSKKDDGYKFLLNSVDAINSRNRTNYKLCSACLNAVEYGVPQSRERIFIVAHRSGKEFIFPNPTHRKPPRIDMIKGSTKSGLSKKDCDLQDFFTAWDAIGHLSCDHEPELEVRGKWAGLLPSIPEGHNYLHHTARGRGKSIFGWRTRYWSMLLKLAKNRPSWTITAQPAPANGPFHWENRRLSSSELSALQTFPKNYKIFGGVLSAHRQLGNAVPSALAELLGLEIRRQFFDSSANYKRTLLPKRAVFIPPPEPESPIPEEYSHYIGEHADHPGSGLGPGAARRISV